MCTCSKDCLLFYSPWIQCGSWSESNSKINLAKTVIHCHATFSDRLLNVYIDQWEITNLSEPIARYVSHDVFHAPRSCTCCVELTSAQANDLLKTLAAEGFQKFRSGALSNSTELATDDAFGSKVWFFEWETCWKCNHWGDSLSNFLMYSLSDSESAEINRCEFEQRVADTIMMGKGLCKKCTLHTQKMRKHKYTRSKFLGSWICFNSNMLWSQRKCSTVLGFTPNDYLTANEQKHTIRWHRASEFHQ